MCFGFAVFVLGITALWVYVLREATFTFLAYAMFFPGATALVWTASSGEFVSFLTKLSGAHEVT